MVFFSRYLAVHQNLALAYCITFLYAYATSHDTPYTLRQMIVIGLYPLFFLCALAISIGIIAPSLATYAAVAFVGNFSGSIGDMWLVSQLWRFRGMENVVFVDVKNGIAVKGTGRQLQQVTAYLQRREDSHSNSFTTVWLTAAAVIVLTTLTAPLVLNLLQFSGHILIGPNEFPFLEYNGSSQVYSFTISPLPSIVSSLLFAYLYQQSRTSDKPTDR
jgi:hypothetical protein